VTVKSRVISPEFRGRMVSFGHGFLNLLFAGMKLPVLLLYYIIKGLANRCPQGNG